MILKKTLKQQFEEEPRYNYESEHPDFINWNEVKEGKDE